MAKAPPTPDPKRDAGTTLDNGDEFYPAGSLLKPPVGSFWGSLRHQMKSLLRILATLIPGVRGEKGEQGPPGDKGEKGWPGDDGQTGHIGNPGEPGKDGSRGHRGREGPPGKTADPGPVKLPMTVVAVSYRYSPDYMIYLENILRPIRVLWSEIGIDLQIAKTYWATDARLWYGGDSAPSELMRHHWGLPRYGEITVYVGLPLFP